MYTVFKLGIFNEFKLTIFFKFELKIFIKVELMSFIKLKLAILIEHERLLFSYETEFYLLILYATGYNSKTCIFFKLYLGPIINTCQLKLLLVTKVLVNMIHMFSTYRNCLRVLLLYYVKSSRTNF